MIRRTAVSVAMLFLLLLPACQKHEFEPPSEEDRISEAEAAYSTALFDSIAWPDTVDVLLEGNAIYAANCRRCHGTVGTGGTEYARSRNLDVPSLVDRDWGLGEELDAVRHSVFVGHVAGMPHWGISHLTYREIEAVSRYILYDLRPEILGR